MPQVFSNNAVGTISGAITNVATTINLQTGEGALFPSLSAGDYFLATLVGYAVGGEENAWEIVRVTARASDALTVVRGQEGTSNVAWDDGSVIELRTTAEGMNDKLSRSAGVLTGNLGLGSKGLTETYTAATGNTFAQGEVGYLNSSGEMLKTDASALGTCDGILGMATAAISAGSPGAFMLLGLVTGLSGLTPGAVYYLSETAGAITATKPVSASAGVRKIGQAISATTLLFNPSMTIIVI